MINLDPLLNLQSDALLTVLWSLAQARCQLSPISNTNLSLANFVIKILTTDTILLFFQHYPIPQ